MRETGNIEEAIAAGIEGEVRLDALARTLYSTDASIYEIAPAGVVLPRSVDDVSHTIRTAGERGVPVLPRGCGTSLAGQTVGEGLQIDFSRHMNRILEVDAEARWARVQPGVVLDELNAAVAPHGLQFGPDVSTSSRANLGGMIGNNSCGSHSIIHGRTVDHVLELGVVLSDGSTATLGPLASSELEERFRRPGIEGGAYREVRRVVDDYAAEIEERFPKVMRRVSGYNLDALTAPEAPFDLSKIVVGSEGTLCAVVEAKVRLVERPLCSVVVACHFEDLVEAMEANLHAVGTAPAASELMDRVLMDQTRGQLSYQSRRGFLQGDPEALLCVEYYGESQAELQDRCEDLEARLRGAGLGYAYVRAFTPEEQKDIWDLRKAGLGLLMGLKGDAKPTAGVEDTSVPVEHLPEYIARVQSLMAEQGVAQATYYGHASVGVIHIRPVLDLKARDGIATLRALEERMSDWVLEYGGAMSAEHGDGLARSEWIEKMFGPRLPRAFARVKAAFDPDGVLNPGKIVDPPPMDANLRYGTGYPEVQEATWFRYDEAGGLQQAVEMCSGVGQCRKKLVGYHVSLVHGHSRGTAQHPRARQRLARRPERPLARGPRERPSVRGDGPLPRVQGLQVRVPIERRHGQAQVRIPRPLPPAARLSPPLSPLRADRPAQSLDGPHLPAGKPPHARQAEPLADGSPPRHRSPTPHAGPGEPHLLPLVPRAFPTGGGSRGTVVFYNDTFTEYNDPQVGRAAVNLLESAGFDVVLPRRRLCCGRPLISKGFLREAKGRAAANLQALAEYSDRGWPVVAVEPSCASTYRDDYLDLAEDADAARSVAGNLFLLDEFLVGRTEGGSTLDFTDLKRRILLHGHCHQKALGNTKDTLELLAAPPGYQVEEIPSGCCGMAGSFGYEREHYDVSLEVGRERLFEVVSGDPRAEIAAAGTSCRHQIADATGRKARHWAEVLTEALA